MYYLQIVCIEPVVPPSLEILFEDLTKHEMIRIGVFWCVAIIAYHLVSLLKTKDNTSPLKKNNRGGVHVCGIYYLQLLTKY